MHRLLVRNLPIQGESVTLDPTVAKHARVLRLEPGDQVLLFDGAGSECPAQVESVSETEITCRVTEATRRFTTATVPLHLVQAIPKGTKTDSIVRMVTELGIHGVHLVETERVVARWEPKKVQAKLERLQRIAEEAVRQSGRLHIPQVHHRPNLQHLVQAVPTEATKIAFWEEHGPTLQPLEQAASAPTEHGIWILVGAEGGISANEIKQLRTNGWITCGLGATILRVETAAPVAVALTLDRMNQLTSRR